MQSWEEEEHLSGSGNHGKKWLPQHTKPSSFHMTSVSEVICCIANSVNVDWTGVDVCKDHSRSKRHVINKEKLSVKRLSIN